MSTPASADNDAWVNRVRIGDLTPEQIISMQGVNPDQDRWNREQTNAWNRNQANNFVSTLDRPGQNPLYAPTQPQRPTVPPGFITDPNSRPGAPYSRIEDNPATATPPATPPRNSTPPPTSHTTTNAKN